MSPAEITALANQGTLIDQWWVCQKEERLPGTWSLESLRADYEQANPGVLVMPIQAASSHSARWLPLSEVLTSMNAENEAPAPVENRSPPSEVASDPEVTTELAPSSPPPPSPVDAPRSPVRPLFILVSLLALAGGGVYLAWPWLNQALSPASAPSPVAATSPSPEPNALETTLPIAGPAPEPPAPAQAPTTSGPASPAESPVPIAAPEPNRSPTPPPTLLQARNEVAAILQIPEPELDDLQAPPNAAHPTLDLIERLSVLIGYVHYHWHLRGAPHPVLMRIDPHYAASEAFLWELVDYFEQCGAAADSILIESLRDEKRIWDEQYLDFLSLHTQTHDQGSAKDDFPANPAAFEKTLASLNQNVAYQERLHQRLDDLERVNAKRVAHLIDAYPDGAEMVDALSADAIAARLESEHFQRWKEEHFLTASSTPPTEPSTHPDENP